MQQLLKVTDNYINNKTWNFYSPLKVKRKDML